MRLHHVQVSCPVGGEDAARRARRSERNKAADGSKKSSGLRSLVKRLFTSS